MRERHFAREKDDEDENEDDMNGTLFNQKRKVTRRERKKS